MSLNQRNNGFSKPDNQCLLIFLCFIVFFISESHGYFLRGGYYGGLDPLFNPYIHNWHHGFLRG